MNRGSDMIDWATGLLSADLRLSSGGLESFLADDDTVCWLVGSEELPEVVSSTGGECGGRI